MTPAQKKSSERNWLIFRLKGLQSLLSTMPGNVQSKSGGRVSDVHMMDFRQHISHLNSVTESIIQDLKK